MFGVICTCVHTCVHMCMHMSRHTVRVRIHVSIRAGIHTCTRTYYVLRPSRHAKKWYYSRCMLTSNPFFVSSWCYVTSMSVERMEVLEYRKKFEVELSTFPDSNNTETQRKLVFSLTCVCVCVCLCEKVCEWISYEEINQLG